MGRDRDRPPLHRRAAHPRPGDAGPDDERRFDYLVTYDRELVLATATLLLRRVPAEHKAPAPAAVLSASPPDPDDRDVPARPRTVLDPNRLDSILATAGISSPHGLTVADASDPELPLVWMNPAFAALTGYREAETLGRNCRFLQGPGTDVETLKRLRGQLSAGRTSRVLLRNYRRDGSAFWNDLQVVPVHDDRGELTHYVGQQHDVTEPVPVGVEGHQVGASIGISLFPADAGSAAELLDHADEAMYRSKEAGRDRVRLYEA